MAVGYLRQVGWIHSSISSFSVFLLPCGRTVKLCAFEYSIAPGMNVSEKMWRHAQLLRHVDLHPWLAPEVLLDGAFPTFSSDVFGVCLLLLEMLSGEKCFSKLLFLPALITCENVATKVSNILSKMFLFLPVGAVPLRRSEASATDWLKIVRAEVKEGLQDYAVRRFVLHPFFNLLEVGMSFLPLFAQN